MVPNFPLLTILMAVAAIVCLILILFLGKCLWLWYQAKLSQVSVSLVHIILMKMRKTPAAVVINAYITAHKAGLQLSLDDLEAHTLCGGNPIEVVQAMIADQRKNIEPNFLAACAANLNHPTEHPA